MVLQLVLAAILDTFSAESDVTSSLTPEQLTAFVECWAEFDPMATQKMPTAKLGELLQVIS